MKTYINKIIFFVIAIITMLVIAYGYVPEVLNNKVVDQSDIVGFRGMAHESDVWNSQHPNNKTAWTNSMFGGMPTIMITGNNTGDYTLLPYNLLQIGKRPATYFFICMLGAFLLMLSLGISYIIAIIGAIAISLCSYNMQIIQVGHNTKMLAMAFLPWVVAACIFTYKSALITLQTNSTKKQLLQWFPKTLLGATLFAFACSFQLKANHIQISYYLAIILFVYVITLFIWVLFKHKDKMLRFWVASALLLIIGLIGIASNANNLLPTYEYSHETMRGGSELMQKEGQNNKKSGLSLDYATAWSYGWEELPNLLIPNYNGGASVGELPMSSHTVELLKNAGQPNVAQIAKQLPLYWGPQPFTAGPMYIGGITIFLFLLGLLLYKGKEKWWLLIVSVIAVLLGLGSHFMPFTKLWFNYAPMYNKFRTVSMALIILQYTLPMLGFLVLDKILKGNYDKKEFTKKGCIAFALTAGFCLLVYLVPSMAGSFIGSNDINYPEQLIQTLQLDRINLLKKDAITAFLLILIVFVCLYLTYNTHKTNNILSNKKSIIAVAAIGVLIFGNLALTGKRYLNNSHFINASLFNKAPKPSLADNAILADNALDYRVLNLTTNVFNDSKTSYLHKSIGGYSPVKMQRYQDLIDYYIQPEIQNITTAYNKLGEEGIIASLNLTPILNMLNTKYIIVNEDAMPIKNPWAYGNCWLIDSVANASTPQEEINLIGQVDLKKVAIVGKDFKAFANNVKPYNNIKDSIYIDYYAPNKLVYKYNIKSPRTAVFSEIYYPHGWTASIENGENVPIFRANWTLRAANLPAGEHILTMTFMPQSYIVGTNISKLCSGLLYLFILLSVGLMAKTIKNKEDN